MKCPDQSPFSLRFPVEIIYKGLFEARVIRSDRAEGRDTEALLSPSGFARDRDNEGLMIRAETARPFFMRGLKRHSYTELIATWS